MGAQVEAGVYIIGYLYILRSTLVNERQRGGAFQEAQFRGLDEVGRRYDSTPVL